jgi:6-phosphogluconate dehydrogenase
MIGLGKMGANMGVRLVRAGHRVIGYDMSADAVAAVVERGVEGAGSVVDLLEGLAAPRSVWLMVPAGEIVDRVIESLLPHLSAGDTIIDGGNSNYKDTVRRSGELASSGIHFIDVGTSGGIWGLAEGYSMMVGGEKVPVYGLMEAYAEGFALLRAKEEFGLDLHQVAEIWRHGSVVRSWLLDLTANALDENPTMEGIAPYVPDSGEGRWTVFEAIDLNVEAPVIALSLMRRIDSRDQFDYSDRLLSAMRNQFGGHAVKREE